MLRPESSRPFSSVCLVIVLLTASVAFSADRQPVPVPQFQIEKYKVPNGLEVILAEDHRLPLVAVNLWYHVVRLTNERAAPASPTFSST